MTASSVRTLPPADAKQSRKRQRETILQELRRLPKKQVAKATLNDIKGDDVPGLAAEVAYHFIFAIPPTNLAT